ncbi:MAG: hypothetical protein MN733_34105 [Nitrososphaera sp.]|nr:hypothetical protein [Nitrososphaera sp.]
MDDNKSFWTTLPGILTGLAAVITAIGGIIAILYQAGVIGPKQNTPAKLFNAPIPEQPACGSVIKMPADNIFLILQWGPVDGTSTYTVEVDCFGCGQFPNNWYSLSGTPWHIKPGLGLRTLRAPIYSSTLHVKLREEGGKSLRWRVWAANPEGIEGKKSNWCQLAFFGS